MPCPNGVDIPRNMAVFNAGLMYGTLEEAKNRYHSLNRDQTDVILGSSCVQCLDCESLCPQGIPISEWMPYIHEILDKGRPYDPAEQPPQRRT
jgi:predicted aldo/keto reductase-like oxidoreductase